MNKYKLYLVILAVRLVTECLGSQNNDRLSRMEADSSSIAFFVVVISSITLGEAYSEIKRR